MDRAKYIIMFCNEYWKKVLQFAHMSNCDCAKIIIKLILHNNNIKTDPPCLLSSYYCKIIRGPLGGAEVFKECWTFQTSFAKLAVNFLGLI